MAKSLSGLTEEEAKEFHEQFKTTVTSCGIAFTIWSSKSASAVPGIVL